jgi:midasin
MALLDGLGSLPQLASYTPETLSRLRADALLKLEELAPLDDVTCAPPTHDTSRYVQFGSFAIAKGPREPLLRDFNFQAPTTQNNAMRVVRACQLPKSVLLEGSPGVGKTSLIKALADISGHPLCRINLSDQTDLVDLFGSDLPVEGGSPGEFAWKDAEFLKAMQEGHWVLLDEMNLAPQAVLEGLNAVLDHRGVIYIPELGRSFTCHPDFRIFAAQNPLHQGSGRKGLPKSFINRFTKVYLDELEPDDLVLVCHHLFPECDEAILRAMVTFNARLNQEITSRRDFAREGGPWEFNLRDVIRWCTLICSSKPPGHPVEYLGTVYLYRFRILADRTYARLIFDQVFPTTSGHMERNSYPLVSSLHAQIGHFHANRRNFSQHYRSGALLQSHLHLLETAGHCIHRSWLSIITGSRNSGKTELVRTLANITGNTLREISVNNATDTMDLLGSFEQVDNHSRALAILHQVLSFEVHHSRSSGGSKPLRIGYSSLLRTAISASLPTKNTLPELLRAAADLLAAQAHLDEHLVTECSSLLARIREMTPLSDEVGRFEWVEGPLVHAMKQGHWVLLDDANLCNPSVLDRLNSLCESNGVLVLSERGYVDGKVQILKPHPNFRLFMLIDPQYGELSRAMRNRGIEMATMSGPTSEDWKRLGDHMRLPSALSSEGDLQAKVVQFDIIRRGLLLPTTSPLGSEFWWPSGRLLDQHSALSVLIEQVATLSIPSSPSAAVSDSLLSFFARLAAPAYLPHLDRFFSELQVIISTGPFLRIRRLLQTLFPRFLSITAGLREEYGRSRSLSSTIVFAQVSENYYVVSD